jgi:hypothetical protein
LRKIAKSKNISEDSVEFNDFLKKQVLRETQLAVFNNKIPGLITNVKIFVDNAPIVSKKNESNEMKNKMKLTFFASLIIQKIMEQNLSVNDQCFLITQLVSGLGLKDTDFKDFQNDFPPDDEEPDGIF